MPQREWSLNRLTTHIPVADEAKDLHFAPDFSGLKKRAVKPSQAQRPVTQENAGTPQPNNADERP